MSVNVTSTAASVLWCTLAPDTEYLEVTFTTSANGRDLSGVTGGKVYTIATDGTATLWGALTVYGTPSAHRAVCRHLFTTGDLTLAMIGTSLTMRAFYTIASVDYPDGPDPFTMAVVA